MEIQRGGYWLKNVRVVVRFQARARDFPLFQRIQIGSGENKISYAMCNAAEALS
jgi:hypothetical protein